MIIALTSISGSPGVTTTALGLCQQWTEPTLLVDVDHHQSILAGYLQARVPAEPGLPRLAMASHLSQSALEEAFWETSIPLPEDLPTRRRLLLRGPAAPWERSAVDRRWGTLAPSLAHLSANSGLDVIMDLGRLQAPATRSASALVSPQLLEHIDLLVVMMHPTLPAVAAARTLVDGLREATNLVGAMDRFGLVLSSPPRRRGLPLVDSFTPREISKALRVPVLGSVVHDPAAAAVLSHGMPKPRRWDSGRLARSHKHLAGSLQSHVSNRSLVVLDQEEDQQ